MGGSSLALSTTTHKTSSASSSSSSRSKVSLPAQELQKQGSQRHKPSCKKQERLRREDLHLPVAQDQLFSDWKVLVGPTDWQDHAAGKEGAERYKLHNLPSYYFGPGVYELGLCKTEHLGFGTRSYRCPQKENTIVVYVGQAENVRTRLQHYGRCGSHLEGSLFSFVTGNVQQDELQATPDAAEKMSDSFSPVATKEGLYCPRFFTEAFSRGYSIAFRWTAVGSKVDAEKLEAGLLRMFDYAWNRGSNGKRRPYDAFAKMQLHTDMPSAFGRPKGFKVQKWFTSAKWTVRQVLIGKRSTSSLQVKSSLRTILTDKFRKQINISTRTSTAIEGRKMATDLQALPLRLQPKETAFSAPNLESKVCGVIVAKGLVCTIVPTKGRKRCDAHKGLRLSDPRVTSKAVLKPTTSLVRPFTTSRPKGTVENVVEPSLSLHCGVLLENGLRCMVLPEKGRKRCALHKGMRAKI